MMTRFDPLAELGWMRETMKSLLADGPPHRHAPTAPAALGSVPFDLYETREEIGVRIAVPGADAGAINLEIAKGVLTIKGQRSLYNGDQEKGYIWHARGLSEGDFRFTVALPSAIDADRAEATYEAGILTVHLPKAEAVKPRRIAIKGAEAAEPAATPVA